MAAKHTKYYDLLEVSVTATPAEIRKAYRVKALQHHPDRAGDTKEATEAFQDLKAVYEVLMDEDRRAVYDTEGDVGNVHGVDTDATMSFFGRTFQPVTAEDIANYERTYRFGADERKDLTDLFDRFDGAVDRVVDYIPYSDESDLVRFVEFFELALESGELTGGAKWRRAKKKMVKAGKGKERDVIEGGESDIGETESGGREKGKKKEVDGDMGGLMAMIQARKQRGKQDFDKWAQKIEEQSKKEESSSGRRNTRRKSQGEGCCLKAEGGVKKKRKGR